MAHGAVARAARQGATRRPPCVRAPQGRRLGYNPRMNQSHSELGVVRAEVEGHPQFRVEEMHSAAAGQPFDSRGRSRPPLHRSARPELAWL